MRPPLYYLAQMQNGLPRKLVFGQFGQHLLASNYQRLACSTIMRGCQEREESHNPRICDLVEFASSFQF
jgi:hypothetical protein